MVDRLALLQAALLPGVSVSDLCRQTGITRKTFYSWRKQYEKEGAAGLEPRSRRPLSSPGQIAPRLEQLICRLREELPCDNGAQHIHDELHRRGETQVPSVRTVHRVLVRNGLVEPQPKKRPRSSYIRFEYHLPNACWQIDATQWKLRNGRAVWIMDLIDDHSRVMPAAVAVATPTAKAAWTAFCRGAEEFGPPAKVLSDNGLCFTAKSNDEGPGLFTANLAALGIAKANSRPYHPQTCGKLERLHQTLKKWLAKQPLARSRAELQRQLDAFRTYYNQHRPHRALDGTTPAQRFAASPTARPADTPLRLTQTHLSLSTVPAKRAGVIHTRGVSITMGSRWAGHDLTVISYGSKIVILDDTRPLRILTLEPGRTSYPLLLPMS